MPNLLQPPHAAPQCVSTHSGACSLNIGADHVLPVYLDVVGIAARRAELRAQGYSVSAAAFVTRLEARENTLLDRTDAGLTAAETAELKALQALLWELHDETKADAALAQPAEAPHAPSARLAGIRRVDMNVPLRERLRRLLNARCASLQTLTGEDHDDTRHRAIFDATRGLTDSSMDRRVTEDEMGDGVSYVEDRLHAAGFDFEAADAPYWERRHAREMAALAAMPHAAMPPAFSAAA